MVSKSECDNNLTNFLYKMCDMQIYAKVKNHSNGYVLFFSDIIKHLHAICCYSNYLATFEMC